MSEFGWETAVTQRIEKVTCGQDLSARVRRMTLVGLREWLANYASLPAQVFIGSTSKRHRSCQLCEKLWLLMVLLS